MYRVIKMSGRFIAIKHDQNENADIDAVNTFTEEGTPIILVNEIEDLSELDIDPDDVEIA